MEELAPIFRVSDARASAAWYARLGFEKEGEHQFAPGLPLYVFIRRDQMWIHLSEHTGDAKGPSLIYMFVEDVDTIAGEFGADITAQPWGREISLTDPDGNRLRIGQRPG